MVTEVVWACVFTALCWWLGTGVILWLDRLPARSFRFSLAGWTVLLALSFWGVAHSMQAVSVFNAYLAFLLQPILTIGFRFFVTTSSGFARLMRLRLMST